MTLALNFLAHEPGGPLVRFGVGQDVVEGHGEARPSPPPRVLENLSPGGFVHLGNRRDGNYGAGQPGRGRALQRLPLAEAVLELLAGRVVERAVACGDGVLRGALEDVDVLGRLGDLGDHLHAAGAGADHADALAGHVDPLGGPAGGVVLGAREGLGTGDRRLVHLRQAAGRRHQVAGRDRGTIRCVDDPAVPALVEAGPLHPGAELDVAPQVEAIRDVIEVALQLRLGGEPLGPVPLLLQLLGERVAVIPTLHVAAGAGIAVPVPRPPHAVALLEHPHGEPQAAQPVQHVQPGRAGADDDRVEIPAGLRASPRGLAPLLGHRESRLPVGSTADGETSGAPPRPVPSRSRKRLRNRSAAAGETRLLAAIGGGHPCIDRQQSPRLRLLRSSPSSREQSP